MATLTITDSITFSVTVYSTSLTVYTKNDLQTYLETEAFLNSWCSLDLFGQSVTYYHNKFSQTEVYQAVLDNMTTSLQLGEGVEVRGIKPSILLSENLMKHKVEKGDYLIINGEKLFIDDYESDGTGGLTLYLRIK